ncbi:hypothetical protein [Pseudomonas silesiensis]|uniref:hypothetical protein n=1 Tax=Pseudomonas silesiensis TaxID=1853130 RepID=UPI00126018A6|nr:hypothetical protein [Pseudomonas silesiensis]
MKSVRLSVFSLFIRQYKKMMLSIILGTAISQCLNSRKKSSNGKKSRIELIVPFRKKTAIFESGKKLTIPVLAVKNAAGLDKPTGMGMKNKTGNTTAVMSKVFLRVNFVTII